MRILRVLAVVVVSLMMSIHAEDNAVGHTRSGNTNNTENLNLTDRDRWESQTYIHEGKAQRVMQEECAKLDDARVCQGSDPGFKHMGMDSSMVKAVSKVYSMVLGFTDGSFKAGENAAGSGETVTTTTTNADGTTTTETTDKKEDQQDYCKYVALGGEMIAMFQQQAAQQNLQNIDGHGDNKSVQKKTLMKAARSHSERAKTAKMQATTWGATGVCYTWYAAQAFMGNIQHSWGLWLKLAGAYFLADFYNKEKKAQEEYAKQVKSIADKLPGPGDCNAITDKDCYCAEKSTMYDPRCMPEMHKRRMADTSYAVPCLNDETKIDKECKCISSDSCFDSKFFQDIKGPGLGNFLNSPAGAQFKSLTRGEFKGGKIDSTSDNAVNAVKKAMDDLMDKKGGPADPNLDKKQLEEAKLIASTGIPLALAKTIAKSPFDKNAQKQFSKLQGRFNSGKYVAKGKKRGPKVLSFSGGSGLRPKTSRKSNNGMDFAKMFGKKKKKKGKGRGKVMKFADKAARSAQINKNSDRPIFEIISRRYQVSGWRRLDIE